MTKNMRFIPLIRNGSIAILCSLGFTCYGGEKSDTKPDQKALEQIDLAIQSGRNGAERLETPKKHNATFSSVTQFFISFEQAKRQASEIDPKALEVRKVELKECEEKFVTPYLAIKERLAQEQASQKQAAEATLRYWERQEKAAEEQEKQSVAPKGKQLWDYGESNESIEKKRKLAKEQAQIRYEKEELEKRTSLAKSKGLETPVDGMLELVEQLEAGRLTLDQAKKLLIFRTGDDQFTVVGTNDPYVFFQLQDGGLTVQIAIEGKPGRIYEVGSRLKKHYNVIFAVTGIEHFATDSGFGPSVVTFKGEAY